MSDKDERKPKDKENEKTEIDMVYLGRMGLAAEIDRWWDACVPE